MTGYPTARQRLGREQGFTLIELLVVVLIIGILAAIAIPVFLGQQAQAKDASIKSDLAVAKVAMVAYATGHDGAYLGVTGAAATTSTLKDYGYTPSTGNTSNVEVKTGGSSFCLQGTSGAGHTFKITASGGVVSGAC